PVLQADIRSRPATLLARADSPAAAAPARTRCGHGRHRLSPGRGSVQEQLGECIGVDIHVRDPDVQADTLVFLACPRSQLDGAAARASVYRGGEHARAPEA